jgi:hypothetical protein
MQNNKAVPQQTSKAASRTCAHRDNSSKYSRSCWPSAASDDIMVTNSAGSKDLSLTRVALRSADRRGPEVTPTEAHRL